MIIANDVGEGSGVMGGENNSVTLLTGGGMESWPNMSKDEVAGRLVTKLASMLDGGRG